MFRKQTRYNKQPEDHLQVGPNREQVSDPTPLGDALEGEVNLYGLIDIIEAKIADLEGSEEDAEDPLQLEQLKQTLSLRKDRAKKAARATFRAMSSSDRLFWKRAAKSQMPPRS